MTDSRSAIKADLEVLRQINIEAKLIRARLREIAHRKVSLSIAAIAVRHGVPVTVVQAVAHRMLWDEEEKSPRGPFPPYEAYHAR